MREILFWVTLPIRLIVAILICLLIPFIILNDVLEEKYKCGFYGMWRKDITSLAQCNHRKLKYTGFFIKNFGIGIVTFEKSE